MERAFAFLTACPIIRREGGSDDYPVFLDSVLHAGRPHHIPCLYLLLPPHRCICRACGGKGNRGDARNLCETVIEASCRSPVERHQYDCRVCPDEARNIIGLRIPDPAVGAARPGTGSDNIPERDPQSRDALAAFRIRECGRNAEKFLDYRPEPVLRVAVILLCARERMLGKLPRTSTRGDTPQTGRRPAVLDSSSLP